MALSKEDNEDIFETKHGAPLSSGQLKLEDGKDDKKDLQFEGESSGMHTSDALSAIHSDKERMKLQVLVSAFSDSQLNRYEMYRRASFPKAAIRRLMQSIMTSSVPPNVVIAMAGIAKVFVGEICEEALDIMDELKVQGPIQPKHIREAVRRLKRRNSIPNTRYKKNLAL